MSAVQAEFTAVIALILGQLLIVLPICFLLVRSWLQSKVDALQANISTGHAATAAKLDTVVQQLTSTNGNITSTR